MNEHDTITVYRMNPAQDKILFGDQLADGMWVLTEDPTMRRPHGGSEDDETWFEVKITYELAHVLQRIINVYIRTGRRKRAKMLARITAVIADPDPGE